mmetsp:Transcript_4065/g.7802  ORF Transcript_4065/g.7802 Transcript_4065/m.7802 type:complete len:621 (+) Transcript_4065:378-2240(+)
MSNNHHHHNSHTDSDNYTDNHDDHDDDDDDENDNSKYYTYHQQDEKEFDHEEETQEDRDFSESASFPTQEDLESIIVHPPGSVPGDVEVRSVSSIEYGLSVTHIYSSVRSIGSAGSFNKDHRIGGSSIGGISVGGGGSSVGGMSEKSETKSNRFLETDRKLSFFTGSVGSEDHPIEEEEEEDEQEEERNVMIAAIPNGITYAASEMTVKSDAATICSGSVMEDIDISSVGTAHSGNAHVVVNGVDRQPLQQQQGKRKQERGVEFASESFPMYTPGMMLSSPMQGSGSGSGYSISNRNSQIPIHFRQFTPGNITMNDMGPPLNRTLLERAASMGLSSMATSMAESIPSYASSTGTTSRPGSVKSFGSQGASEVVHVDTDDCGGSIVDSDGHFSGGGQEDTPQEVEMYKSKMNLDLDAALGAMGHNKHYGNGCEVESHVQSNDISLATFYDRLSVDHGGQTSPEGIMYRGRRVNRYQGRIIQNMNSSLAIEGTVIGHDTKSTTNNYFADHHDSNSDGEMRWRRDGSRSRSRSRDRSRSRERSAYRGGTRTNSNRMRSRSISPLTRRRRSPPRYDEDRGTRGGSRNQYHNDNARWGNDQSSHNGSNYQNNRSFSTFHRRHDSK